MKKCYMCEKGELKKKMVPYKLYGIEVGKYKGEECSKCGEIFYSEGEFDKMTKKVKQLKLWGLETKSKISKVGNSLNVRISKKIAEFTNIKQGKEVMIQPIDKNKVMIIT